MPAETLPPSLADIERIALATIARLPPPFAAHIGGVLLRVEEFPDDALLQDLGIEDAFDLTGLYQGRSVAAEADGLATEPDIVFLYRRPILDEWAAGEDSLETLVAHVVIHEFGHHFGLSDDDIDRIEAAT